MSAPVSTSSNNEEGREPASSPPPPREWPWVLGLSLLAALPALLIYPFPTHDGHQHHFTAFVIANLSDPQFGFAEFFEFSFPRSSQGYVLILAGLGKLLVFPIAERLALALLLALFPLGAAWASRHLGRSAIFSAGMAALASFGWVLAMGFLNFMLAAAFLLPFLALSQTSSKKPTPLSLTGLSLLLVFMAWLHVAVAAAAGLLAVALALGRRGSLKSTLLLGLSGLPAAAYAVWVASAAVSAEQLGFVTENAAYFTPLGDRLTGLWELGTGALSPTSALLFAVLMLSALFAPLPTAQKPSRRRFGLLIAVLVLAYLLAPLHAARWAFLAPRPLFLAGLLAAALPVTIINCRSRQLLFSGIVALGLLAASLNAWHWSSELRPRFIALAEAPHQPAGPVLPLELSENPVELDLPRHVEPTLHAGLWPVRRRGGLTPYVFATNAAAHSIFYRQPPAERFGPAPGAYIRRGLRCEDREPADCLRNQRQVVDRIALYGLPWQEILLQGASILVHDQLRRRGYFPVYDRADVSLWRPQLAALQLNFQLPPGPLPGNLILRAGYPDGLGWVAGRSLPAGAQPPSPLQADLLGLLAGPITVEAFIDLDGDGEMGGGEPSFHRQDLELNSGGTVALSIQLGRGAQ